MLFFLPSITITQKQIISNEGATLVSEGIDANFYDILNYAVFALIQISSIPVTA